MIETLSALVQPWADFYAESTLLATLITAVHLLAMFGGGGLAIAADRRVLRAHPGTFEALQATADDLRSTHSLVIGALVLTVASGASMALADVATFAVSRVYWTKMAMFAVLIGNGLLMRRAESAVLHGAEPTHPGDPATVVPMASRPWGALRRSAWISLIVWFTIVALGVLLTNS